MPMMSFQKATPAGPWAPAGPGRPWGPFGPSGPVGPGRAWPAGPGSPVGPWAPAGPSGPGRPVGAGTHAPDPAIAIARARAIVSIRRVPGAPFIFTEISYSRDINIRV